MIYQKWYHFPTKPVTLINSMVRKRNKKTYMHERKHFRSIKSEMGGKLTWWRVFLAAERRQPGRVIDAPVLYGFRFKMTTCWRVRNPLDCRS